MPLSFRHIAWLLCLMLNTSLAQTIHQYVVPESGNSLIGENSWVTASTDDTLIDLAARYQSGYNLLRAANPGVDPWLPGEGTQVLLPEQTILPSQSHEGIVINVAEMRLYHFRQEDKNGQQRVDVFPISVGRGDWSTPVTTTHVTGRAKDPVWYPPESIRAEHAARGDYLPSKVPAGPNNPLGPYLLTLDIPSYFIHGTNKRFGIGMQVTHGCIRMYPEDIEQLVKQTPNDTPVTIINQPFKAGWQDTTLYLEVHPPLEGENGVVSEISTTAVVHALIEATQQMPEADIDWDRVNQVIAEARGIPQKVGVLDRI